MKDQKGVPSVLINGLNVSDQMMNQEQENGEQTVNHVKSPTEKEVTTHGTNQRNQSEYQSTE